MTNMRIRGEFIKASPETDGWIAEAIGWRYAGFCRKNAVYYTTSEDDLRLTREMGVDFAPTTNLNDAWLAAEKFCGAGFQFHLQRDGSYIEASIVSRVSEECYQWTSAGSDDDQSPAMAICGAILAATISKQKQTTERR